MPARKAWTLAIGCLLAVSVGTAGCGGTSGSKVAAAKVPVSLSSGPGSFATEQTDAGAAVSISSAPATSPPPDSAPTWGAPTASVAPLPAAPKPVVARPTTALTKAEFLSEADSLCADVNSALTSVPPPIGLGDPNAASYFASTEATFAGFLSEIQALVARSPDRATLTAEWTAVDLRDFTAARPLVEQTVQALRAGDVATVQALVAQLDAQPDHSNQIMAFLTDYGLPECANLESN